MIFPFIAGSDLAFYSIARLDIASNSCISYCVICDTAFTLHNDMQSIPKGVFVLAKVKWSWSVLPPITLYVYLDEEMGQSEVF